MPNEDSSILSSSYILDEEEKETVLGTTVIEIVRQDPKRVFLLIQNRSDTDVFISTKQNITTSTGFRLIANYGSLSYTKRDHGSLVTKAHFGITSVATKTVVSQEALAIRKPGK
ncbi:MAG TPA: hypothetical protein VI522_07390 [Gammaproteobacteria bacterium]|nr:hypothetical protein [Gammaproteobacteria bacterium]